MNFTVYLALKYTWKPLSTIKAINLDEALKLAKRQFPGANVRVSNGTQVIGLNNCVDGICLKVT